MDLAIKIDKIKILLASPRGFCAGVDRAIDIVEKALKNSIFADPFLMMKGLNIILDYNE